MVHVIYWRDLPLHVLLVALVLSQVFLLREISESETRLTQVTLRRWFTPPGVDSQSALYSTIDTLAAVNATLNTYYNEVHLSLHDIGYALDEQGQILPVELKLHGRYTDPALREPFLLYNNTDPTVIGPFNLSKPDEVQAIFINSTGMKTTVQLADLDHPSFLYIVETVYHIDEDVIFVSLDLPRNFKGKAKRDSRFYIFLFINISIILLSSAFLVLSGILFARVLRLYRNVRAAFMSIPRERLLARCRYGSWSEIPLKVKLQFFQDWWFIMTICHGCLITAAVCSITDQYSFRTNFVYQLTEALGVLLVTTTLIRYVEPTTLFNTASRTLQAAGFNLVRTAISILPIFAAYAIFGTVVFAPCSPMFRSLEQSAQTLFYLLFGDSIQETIRDLNDSCPMWSSTAQVYLLTFICFYLLAVLKIFIQVIAWAFKKATRSIADTEAVKRKAHFLTLMDIVQTYAHKARKAQEQAPSHVDEESPLLGGGGVQGDDQLISFGEALARLQASERDFAEREKLSADEISSLLKLQTEWADAQVQAVRDTSDAFAAQLQSELLKAYVSGVKPEAKKDK